MTDWRPIDTAPRDGTVVRLLCSVGDDRPKFEAVGRYRDLGAWTEVGKNGGLLVPTHWAPIPDGNRT